MTYSSLLVHLSLAFVAAEVYSLHDSQASDSLLSTLSSLEHQTFYIASLEEDLKEFSESSPLSRQKRHAAKEHRIYPKCCGSGDKPDFTEETVQIYENCRSQLNESERQKGAGVCRVAVCIGEEKGVLDADGFVKEEEFVNLIDEAYTDVSLKDAARNAGPGCVKQANERAKETMNNGMLERSCNPAGIMAYHCAKYEVILNCPEDQTVNNEECNNFRQMMQKWKSKK